MDTPHTPLWAHIHQPRLAHPQPSSIPHQPPQDPLPPSHSLPLAPPTPAPSPRPTSPEPSSPLLGPSTSYLNTFPLLPTRQQRAFLTSLIPLLTSDHLRHLNALITPLLQRDFLRDLPIELALHVLRLVDDPRTLARASQVSRTWRALLLDEHMWREMCRRHGFDAHLSTADVLRIRHQEQQAAYAQEHILSPRPMPALTPPLPPHSPPFSYRRHFVLSFLTDANWRRGGRLLITHPPSPSSPPPMAGLDLAPLGAVPGIPLLPQPHLFQPQPGHVHAHHHPPQPAPQTTENVVTSLAMDDDYIVVGLANCRVHVYNARSGALFRTLVGHESGVWCLGLASATPREEFISGWKSPATPSVEKDSEETWNEEQRRNMSDPCGASRGWGNPGPVVVSGGCDRDVRVWDVESGECKHVLGGHSSTIRCLKLLHDRSIAVTGSRDGTLRVWDVQRGQSMHVLAGHQHSVRCLEVWGNLVVSGSYDCTARLWNVDTGECLQIYRGHFHQIYAVAFDGERVVTGSLDSTVRVWTARNAESVQMLTGHTSLVGQLQLTSTHLATGGSDGRVMLYALPSLAPLHRLLAHDNSVTCLQIDHRFLVSGGNDGRVKLYDLETGTLIRELTEPCEAIWRVSFGRERCVVLCKRDGRTVMEVLNFRPEEGELNW
ncbi:WD40 repeat-like protein [Dacryopinax primogenitus]|uniref:WD40 repeat-like protein n=1 Tax=Dacryopinax primogenitus (strain DJM 731) TaxID=1858805 RepID=M5GCF3_DACPD|nr:WD40 repeat-like protein [Dacryopinax primogenitus]EJU03857.1 WD40 repeat-like protein [Dacryopinax primogenitus]